MSDTVIKVENLSKAYLLGHQEKQDTLFGSMLSALKSPLRNFQQLRRMNTYNLNPEDEDEDILWALRDVSFEVKRGEVLGIIGRNGAGKSTLLKILSRIADPTHGRAEIRGRVSALLEVGTGFHPELTGRENIYLNGTILGMKKAEIDSKFDEIVDFSGVERFLDTPVKRYSSGMRVRLAFSVAAHLEPEILIIDEVLAVGDAEFQKKCLGKMSEVSTGDGRTVLFVSHNMTAVNSLCHKAILLKSGHLTQMGTAQSITNEYLATELEGSNSDLNLEELERREGHANKLMIKNLSINEGDPILHGCKLSIDIEYEAFENVAEVAFGIVFVTSDGSRVMSIDSDIPGERYAIQTSGNSRLRLTLPELHLQPGVYFLHVGARSGDNKMLDLLEGFTQINVMPGPDTPTAIIGRTRSSGVRVPAHWEHLTTPQPEMMGQKEKN